MKSRDTNPPAAPNAAPGPDPETTLDLIKALENAAIVMDEPPPPAAPAQQPAPEPSYNPYDRVTPTTGRKR